MVLSEELSAYLAKPGDASRSTALMRTSSIVAVVVVTVFTCAVRATEASEISLSLSSRVATRLFSAGVAPCDATDAIATKPALAFSANRRMTDASPQTDAQPMHAVAVEHSDAYRTRAKIHKIASFATLPLFAAEVALGQSLYSSVPLSAGKRSAHIAVGTGIMGLFAVNTITGAWNLLGEDRQETKGGKLRVVHALLMMISDAGFVATAATGPGGHRQGTLTLPAGASTHRDIAFGSIGVGTVGYLLMLLGNR